MNSHSLRDNTNRFPTVNEAEKTILTLPTPT